MARSTSTRRTTRTSAKAQRKSSARRNLKYYTFQSHRDDISHTRNANNIIIVDRTKRGAAVSLSLQEAISLYNFLGSQIRSR